MKYVIADISSNWLGDLRIAKDLIDACAGAGADAIKMQFWHKDLLYGKTHPYWQMIVQVEMNFEKMRILSEYAKVRNIAWFTSTFDARGIDFLATELDVPYFKLASCVTSCMGLRVADRVAPYAKWVTPFENMLGKMAQYPEIPVIASLDVHQADQITLKQRHDAIVKLLPKSTIFWLMTHSLYPLESHNVKKLGGTVFNYPSQSSLQNWEWAGLSDHTQHEIASLYAVCRGATFIERPVAFQSVIDTEATPDSCVSITPEQLGKVVRMIRSIEFLEHIGVEG